MILPLDGGGEGWGGGVKIENMGWGKTIILNISVLGDDYLR